VYKAESLAPKEDAMLLRLYVEWGSEEDPQDGFFCDYELPFLPVIGMEFALSVKSADTAGTFELLPHLVVERLTLIDYDPSMPNTMVDVHFKPLSEEEMKSYLRHFQVDKRWQQ
jgi:hypothetical protein